MATTATKSGKATMKDIFPNWEVKERIYVLTKKATPITFQLRSRHTDYRSLEWYDKQYGYPRTLRYVTNQTTFFEDEQKEGYKLGAIVFEDGKLKVPATNTTLQQFLALHPDNKANGGGSFYEFDPDAEARAALDREMKGFEAVAIAIDMGIEDLEAIARVAYPTSDVDSMTSGEIKRDVVMFAKNKPEKFTEIANNSNIQMRNLASKAIKLGIIKIGDDNCTVKWAVNGKEITKLPFSSDPIETLAVWMKTDKGIEFVEGLVNKISA